MQLPTRDQMVDSMGKPITQSLFLEIGYQDTSIYTLKEDHFPYKGKILPSIKKLYLECSDPTEYEFATTYLLGWKHWQRIYSNRLIKPHIDEWREELEMKLRSRGVKEAIKQASTGSFIAAKWVADRGWEKRIAGRPSKSEQEREARILDHIADDYQTDVVRMLPSR